MLKNVASTATIAYTGTAGNGSAVTDNLVSRVAVSCTSAAYVKVGKAATATTGDIPVGIGQWVILPIQKGERVSVIQQSAGGNAGVIYGSD